MGCEARVICLIIIILLVFVCGLFVLFQKGHTLRAEFKCASKKCKQKRWWASSRVLGGRYLVNQR